MRYSFVGLSMFFERLALARGHMGIGLRIAGFGCVALLPGVALAELSNDSMLGPGLRSRPAYDGSDSQRQELVPVVRHFGQHWFLRSTQGVLEAGARTELGSGLHAGAQVVYEPGRQSSESAYLERHHVAGIQRGASVGLQLEWDHAFGPMPVTLLARTRSHTDSSLGNQVDLRLSAGVFQSGRFGAGVFTQFVWADTKSARAFYGMDAQQSALSGLPVFQPGSGWLNASFGLLWSVNLNQNWIVVGSMEARRLRGDAARSPLSERLSNHYASAGLAYHF